MDETDNRKESDGKSLFIIRDGRKVASFEAGKWVPLLPGVVVRNTQDGIKIEGPQRPALCFPLTPHPRDVVTDFIVASVVAHCVQSCCLALIDGGLACYKTGAVRMPIWNRNQRRVDDEALRAAINSQ